MATPLRIRLADHSRHQKSIGWPRHSERTQRGRAVTHQRSHLRNGGRVSKLKGIAQLAIPVAEPTLQLLNIGTWHRWKEGRLHGSIDTQCVSLSHQFHGSPLQLCHNWF